MAYSCKILADSMNSATNNRLTTFEITYPRMVHCFDDKTEVLVLRNGRPAFVLWPELEYSDLIAAYNTDNGKIEFEVPQKLYSYDYDGDMISVNKREVNFVVTANHRLFVGSRKAKHDEWEFIYAQDLLGAHTQKRFKKAGYRYTGTRFVHKTLSIVGFFIGDGSLNGKKAVFHLRKQRKIDFLINELNEYGLDYSLNENSDGTYSIRVPLDEFWHSMLSDCYDENGNKQIPLVLSGIGNKYDFGALLEGILESDGSISSCTDKRTIINTSSKTLVDQLLAMAPLCDVVINETKPYLDGSHNGIYKLTVVEKTDSILRVDKHPASLIRYSGKVFCATVSTGALVVRRNGTVHISGNSELMTHRLFSRNTASSRAIPISKMIERVQNDPVMPVWWGKNQSGMQAKEELTGPELDWAKEEWLAARDEMVWRAQKLNDIGLHKQIANRILEPWMWITAIVSATEWDNWFNLRCHPDAQPEIQKIANMMHESYNITQLAHSLNEVYSAHTPQLLSPGEWHMPLTGFEGDENLSPEDLRKVAVGRCARVSYLTHDGRRDPEADLKLFTMLYEAPHLSPFEHVAQAQAEPHWDANYRGWRQYRKFVNPSRTS